MQNKTQEYHDGYVECMKDFELYLHEAMIRNGGCVTGLQAFNVVSEIALWTHQQALRIRQAEQIPQETVHLIFSL